APLGPINAVIVPRCTSRCSTSTAVRPPKLRRTPSTTRIGAGLATPGTGSTPAIRSTVAPFTSLDIDQHLLAVADEPLRPEDDQHQQRHTHQGVPHAADLGTGDEGRSEERRVGKEGRSRWGT